MEQRTSIEHSARGIAPASEEASTWRGRRKRRVRRLRNDLRLAAPIAAIVFCFALSATAIFATDWIPVPAEATSLATSAPTSSLPAVSAPAAQPTVCDRAEPKSPSFGPAGPADPTEID